MFRKKSKPEQIRHKVEERISDLRDDISNLVPSRRKKQPSPLLFLLVLPMLGLAWWLVRRQGFNNGYGFESESYARHGVGETSASFKPDMGTSTRESYTSP